MGLGLLVTGYVVAARGRLDSPIRAVYFASAVAITWLALESPIDIIGDRYLESVHMLQHVLLGVVAPPLFVLGLSPAMAELLRRLPWFSFYTEPIPAQLIAAAVMLLWHIPALYELTLYYEQVHVFEHLTFIAAGFVFWWPVVSSTSARGRWRLGDWAKLVYLLVGTFAQDAVSLVLMFSRVPFYEFYVHQPRLLTGLDPLVDQTLAGAILMLVGKTSYLIAALVIFFRAVAADNPVKKLEISPQ